jgi:tRNA A37 threonylcarbamoyladenosine synthetase subunit TsaC/SUA5/YrdC
MLSKIVESIDPLEQKLIDTFWPGPLTIKFKQKAGALPNIVSCRYKLYYS